MKRFLKPAGLALVLVLVVAQFIQPDISSPRPDPARRLWNDHRVNPHVAGIMRRACANCHSYDTQWPWYAKISPVSWWLAYHVNKGREKLNFDNWSTVAASDELEEIYDSIAKQKMPLWSYLLMHPEARLTQSERDALLTWADSKPDSGSPVN